MKGKSVFGTLVGLVIVMLVSSPVQGADPPKYDATGTWDYQSPGGVTNCPGGISGVAPGVAAITQSGDTFTIDFGEGDVLDGSVSGTRYLLSSGEMDPTFAMVQSMVFNLDSASFASGLMNMIMLDDDGKNCSYAFDIQFTKRGPCTPSDTVMCLQKGRFSVSVTWEDQEGNTGVGHAVPSTDNSGLFWFFGPANMELLIKVLNGCTNNGRYWVFFAATTDQGFRITVTDNLRGSSRQYSNPLGFAADAVTDTAAFATCP